MKVSMDIERTIEFLLQQQANFEAREAAAKERFDAQMAQVGAKLQQVADNQQRLTDNQTRSDKEIGLIRNELRRAVRLAVQEAREERRRRQEGDAKLAEDNARLAASQEELRQTLKAFIDSMKHSSNGHDKN